MSCFFLEFETKTWFAMNHLKQTMLALKTIEQWEKHPAFSGFDADLFVIFPQSRGIECSCPLIKEHVTSDNQNINRNGF